MTIVEFDYSILCFIHENNDDWINNYTKIMGSQCFSICQLNRNSKDYLEQVKLNNVDILLISCHKNTLMSDVRHGFEIITIVWPKMMLQNFGKILFIIIEDDKDALTNQEKEFMTNTNYELSKRGQNFGIHVDFCVMIAKNKLDEKTEKLNTLSLVNLSLNNLESSILSSLCLEHTGKKEIRSELWLKTTFDELDSFQNFFDPALVLQFSYKSIKVKYDEKDAILYALSIGYSPEKEDLKYLYEKHMDFVTDPSFGTSLAFTCCDFVIRGKMMGCKIDLKNVLHGEQYTQVLRPLPASGTIKSSFKIVEFVDKGTNSLLILDVYTKNDKNVLLMRNQFTIVLRNFGGFESSFKSRENKRYSIIPSPQRPPDSTHEYKTSVSQAALFRLNGDLNPLHIFSETDQKPILHGLCTYGIVFRQLSKVYGPLGSIKMRFASIVIPGQTLLTKMWTDKENRILFSCFVKETNTECISGGWAHLSTQEHN